MERGEVTFDDVAVYFTKEEWQTLQEEQKSLYKEVMNDNYQMILSLNRPDLITNIELGCDPYITTARANAIQDSWQDERLAASDKSIFQEGIDNTTNIESVPPLKRQRRYPRVNPFRWTKKHKKSKSQSQRTSRRSEHRGNGLFVGSNYETYPECGVTDQPDVAGDSREGHSALNTKDSSDSVQTSEKEVEQNGLQTNNGNRRGEGDESSRTLCITYTKTRPDLRVTVCTLQEEALGNDEVSADLGHKSLHMAEALRATSTLDAALPPDEHNIDIRDEDELPQSFIDAANPATSSSKTTDAVHPDEEKCQEKKSMDSVCEGIKTSSPWRKEKHVMFSDTVTTFIIEPEATEDAEKGSEDGMRLRSKSYLRPINLSFTAEPKNSRQEYMVMRSQDSRSNSRQPERKTTVVHDLLARGNQDLKSRNSIRCTSIMKKTEEVQGSLPCAKSVRGTAEPPLSTGPQLQSKNSDEENLVTKSPDSRPNAKQPERKTTAIHDLLARGNQDPKSQNSRRCISMMKKTEEGSSPCVKSAEPPLSTGPQLQSKNSDEENIVTKIQDSSTNATQPEMTTVLHDMLKMGNQDLKNQHSMNCNKLIKKMEEVQGSPPFEESVSGTTEFLQSTGLQLQPKMKDVGTQIDLVHKEEKHQTESIVQLAPPEPSNRDQNYVKSYSCSNCGKVTHWTRLNDQQKADVKKSFIHICKMCSRQKDKTKAAPSPQKDSNTQSTPTKCAESGRTIVTRSPTRKKPHGSLHETRRTSTSHIVQLKKGEETQRNSTNDDIQVKNGEESLRTLTSHNVQLKKGEETQRNSTNDNIQLKGEEEAQRTSTNDNVQLKKGEEETRNSASHNDQQKNCKEALPNLLISPIGKVKKSVDPKKCLAEQSDNSSLCSQCGHLEASKDVKLHHKVKAVNGTPPKKASANVLSSSDLKNSTPEKRKSNKILQNETNFVQEKLTSDSRSSKSIINPDDQKNDVQTKNGAKHACTKCGKQFLKRQNTKPLTSIQHKKPARGDSTISMDRVQKSRTKSDAVRKERSKKSLKEHKKKKPRNAEYPKRPRPARSRDRVLCTKCGKRLALHVAPNQDSPSEGGGNENACVLLPKKTRKRRLANIEPFKCKECGKIFTRHFTLQQHRLIHTGERPYACNVCRKTFRDSSYLIVHMRSHTKEKPYTCTECGKCFSQNSALHVHCRTHKDERPFCCQVCGKSFTDRSTYRHHMRIHTGEKPYACSYCGKKFTQQPHMKRHETIHTGERPFGCAQCGKRFIERSKLKKHELIHQKGKD